MHGVRPVGQPELLEQSANLCAKYPLDRFIIIARQLPLCGNVCGIWGHPESISQARYARADSVVNEALVKSENVRPRSDVLLP